MMRMIVLEKSIIKFFKDFEISSRPGMLLNLTRSCEELKVSTKRMYSIAKEHCSKNKKIILLKNGKKMYLRRI